MQNTKEIITLPKADDERIIWGIQPREYTDESLRNVLQMLRPAGVFLQGTYTADALKDQIERIRSLSGRPLLIAIDQEGGVVRHVIDDPNPGARELSKLRDEEQCVYLRETDTMLANAGVDINFGLIGDVATHRSDVMKYRAYSSDPREVAKYVERYMRCTSRVKQTVKHFPGVGGTDIDSHDSIPVFTESLSKWADFGAIPFIEAIRLEVPIIMMGHSRYPSVDTMPASLSARWVHAIRSKGYEGILITDDLGMLGKNPEELALHTNQAFAAGNDLVLISSLSGADLLPAFEAIQAMSKR